MRSGRVWHMWRSGRLSLVGVTLLLGCASPAAPIGEAVVVFGFPAVPARNAPAEELRVLVRNAAAIARARTYIERGGVAVFPSGLIVRGVGIDPRYPFHFLPETVVLTEGSAEFCGYPLMHTAADVDSLFKGQGDIAAPTARWCPVQARPIAVE